MMERFYDKVDAGPGGGCHLWMAATNEHGYGRIWMAPGMVYAHRLAWELRRGAIPKGLCALHKCDRPRCVNPDHMFLGTRADNVADMVAKGRQALGSDAGGAKLTPTQVAAIRVDPRRRREIAADYGIHRTMVDMIRRGERWGWLK